MNFNSISNGKNVERRPRSGECTYFDKVFKDSQALGGHLRTHREYPRSRKSWNGLGCSSNSSNLTGPTPNPHMTTQVRHFFGGFGNNQVDVFSKEMPSLIFPKRSDLNDNEWVNVGQFSKNSVGNTKTPLCVSPNFSTGGAAVEIHHFNPFSSAPAYCTNPLAVSPSHSLLLGLGNVCQFNIDQSQPFMIAGQFYENSLPNFQYPNQGPYVVAGSNPIPSSNEMPAFREPTNGAPIFPNHNHLAEQGEFDHILTYEGGKRCCFGEALEMRSASKRPKIDYDMTMETMECQKKELILFKDIEKSFSALEISAYVNSNEESTTNLDLSLHL